MGFRTTPRYSAMYRAALPQARAEVARMAADGNEHAAPGHPQHAHLVALWAETIATTAYRTTPVAAAHLVKMGEVG